MNERDELTCCTVIKCTPTSMFSWNFVLSDSGLGPVSTTLDAMTEEGTITVGSEVYPVNRRTGGVINRGIWSLMVGGDVYAEGEITAVLVCTLEIRVPGSPLLVGKAVPFSRVYQFSTGGHNVGKVAPGHIFTRASTIDFTNELPELTQIFCFWIAAASWYESSSDQ